jgi:hypothetical protein
MSNYIAIIAIIFLTALTGIADSQGFIYSAQVWQKGKFIWINAGKSILSFSVGIMIYWLAIKFMQQVGIISAEIQTTIWFAITIVGVAIASGKFFHWSLTNQFVSVLVLIGIGFLIIKTGG